MPPEDFSWDLSVISASNNKRDDETFHAGVVRADPIPAAFGANLSMKAKLKLKSSIEFSLTSLDKLSSKGFTNNSNCCFMNVCLQALLSSPPFFNMLVRIGESSDLMSELCGHDDKSLLGKFVHLARYFNPRD